MTPRNPNRRALRWTYTGAAALLLLLTAGTGAARADGRHGDRGRHQHIAKSERHGVPQRGRARGHRDDDRQRSRQEAHRYDNQRRRDAYRHDSRRYDSRRYDDRRRYDSRRHDGRRYDGRRYQYRPRHFDVPRAIAYPHFPLYRPYHYGRVFYAGHRHDHDVYRFPVYSEWGVEYYPYAYCEGSFFGRGVFRLGRAVFDIHIGF